MGYNTSYNGAFKIEPPLTKEEFQRFAQVVPFWNSDDIKQRAISDVFSPGLTKLTPEDKKLETGDDCTFTLHPEQIKANEESVKAYNDQDAFIVIAQWLTDNGHQLTGEATWAGDSNDDSGAIYAAHVDGKNLVEFVTDEQTNAGPSWQPSGLTDARLASMVRNSAYFNAESLANKGHRFLLVLAVGYGAEDSVTTLQGAFDGFRELLTADDWDERRFQVYDAETNTISDTSPEEAELGPREPETL